MTHCPTPWDDPPGATASPTASSRRPPRRTKIAQTLLSDRRARLDDLASLDAIPLPRAAAAHEPQLSSSPPDHADATATRSSSEPQPAARPTTHAVTPARPSKSPGPRRQPLADGDGEAHPQAPARAPRRGGLSDDELRAVVRSVLTRPAVRKLTKRLLAIATEGGSGTAIQAANRLLRLLGEPAPQRRQLPAQAPGEAEAGPRSWLAATG